VYLPIIYNILQLRLPDCELKESLKVSRELWKSANEVASLQLVRSKIIPSKPGKTEDFPVTPKDIWDMWINGKYFHNDTEKKADLISFAGWAEGLVKYGFIDYLIKVTKEINYVELAIREALVMHKAALTP
jgi:hypothetical protein